MQPVYGYERCSTEEQSVSGLGLDAQHRDILALASLRRLGTVQFFKDPGESGARPLSERPAGKGLVQTLSLRPGIVIVSKLDRLFRNAADACTTISEWHEKGISLVSIHQGLDLTTAYGRFVARLFGLIAELEREMIVDRTKAAMAEKRARGERVSQTMHYGWIESTDGTPCKCPREQKIISQMKNLASRGHSTHFIAKHLNDNHIPTKRGGVWRHGTIARILEREGWTPPATPIEDTPRDEPSELPPTLPENFDPEPPWNDKDVRGNDQ